MMTSSIVHRRFDRQPQHSPVRWPDGSGLAVSFVLNIEEGAEYSLTAGDARNEGLHEVDNEIVGVPDFCMETHFEYGARAGYQRIANRFIQRGIPITLNICGRALECTPWVALDALAYQWEMCGHGWLWESPAHMDEPQERRTIERTIASIEHHWGRRPSGWHCKSSASVRTRNLLQEMDFLYDSNDYGGEVPFRSDTPQGRPYVILPYAFDTNDMRFFGQGTFVHAHDFSRYVIAAIDTLLDESLSAPRLLTIGLHTRILGRPARIGALDAILGHLQRKHASGHTTWLTTREAIAKHWLHSAT